MKRMSEVFELPVSNVFGSALAKYSRKEVTQHAAHAINNVDAMADALEEALLQIEYVHKKFGETGSGNSVLSRGNSALKSYRGLK